MRKGYYACALLLRLVRALKAVLLEDSLKTCYVYCVDSLVLTKILNLELH